MNQIWSHYTMALLWSLNILRINLNPNNWRLFILNIKTSNRPKNVKKRLVFDPVIAAESTAAASHQNVESALHTGQKLDFGRLHRRVGGPSSSTKADSAKVSGKIYHLLHSYPARLQPWATKGRLGFCYLNVHDFHLHDSS